MIYLLVIQVIIVHAQMNIYWRNDNGVQHDCLRLAMQSKNWEINNLEILSFCWSESPGNFPIDDENFFPRFTFAQLWKAEITAEQLYHWSTPIDIIERYQTNDSSLSNEIIYNCTWPRFGSSCQYEIDHYHSNLSTLSEIITDYYHSYPYHPTSLTCYEHVICDRGPGVSCLDWSEICDGKIDCLSNGIDEKHCWLLEIHQCEENEYRCRNGQCIPQAFYRDDSHVFDCLDGSDEVRRNTRVYKFCDLAIPSLSCEDLTCVSTFLTPSCTQQRTDLLLNAIYSSNDRSVSEPCWSAFRCIVNAPNPNRELCDEHCAGRSCLEVVRDTCPEMILMPNIPVLFGEIYLAYTKNESEYLVGMGQRLVYLCYHNSHYDDYFQQSAKIIFKNMTCFRGEQPPEVAILSPWDEPMTLQIYNGLLSKFYPELKQYYLNFNYSSQMCNRSTMYQCIGSSKCISIHRLLDAIDDCPSADDENLTIISELNVFTRIRQMYFHCGTSDRYISPSLVTDDQCDCLDTSSDWCTDEDVNINFIKKNISFQTICDGFVELIPVKIDDRNETDETNCQQWQCDNIYTHCNGIWNCPNGRDEIGCDPQPLLNCSNDHHFCVSPITNELTCLSMDKANDGQVDCLGGTDEVSLCRILRNKVYEQRFYCRKENSPVCILPLNLCNDYENCDQKEDEQFCMTNRSYSSRISICLNPLIENATKAEKFLCRFVFSRLVKHSIIYFSLDSKPQLSIRDSSNSISVPTTISSPRRCHRGLDIRIWLNNQNHSTRLTCFCPPSFYGDQCQYQNDRISLAIQFRALSDSRHTLFAMIVSLIDDSDQRLVHSLEQFSYLSVRDCSIKFQMNLLYAHRPKNLSREYFIQLDIYEKVSLIYRGSFLYPVKFSFLPVYRLGLIVDIPRRNSLSQSCSFHRCLHGRCVNYRTSGTFCQCHSGWSGKYCSIPYRCTCSLCVGIDAQNRSICLCPMGRFGPRCYLIDRICEKCENGGQCIANDEYQMASKRKFVCICRKGFSGDRCEIADRRLMISFGKDIHLSSSIFIHFIQIFPDNPPIRTTSFRTIPLTNDSLVIYWSRPFHLLFIEFLDKTYYLPPIEQISNPSLTINPSNRCPNISEIFNETFSQMHLLNRIKFYHLSCENLSCFYDDVHLCLCYSFQGKRLANCLNFQHQMTFDCFGQSECENGGQCFQDTLNCPQRSICICPRCFYGTRCQFNTNGFSLSLDAILGYHILPQMALKDQPSIVKFSLITTIIFILLGLINGILSLITFKNKIIREVGSGWYLLGSAMMTLIGMIIFGLKLMILIFTQMASINNRLFLQIQCLSLDFLLGICLSMNQWFDACVAIERAIAVIKGARFIKEKSKKIARRVSLLLVLLVILTSIHDPISRRLFIEQLDDDQTRIWCIVSFASHLQIYNTTINIFHFITPLMINLISAIILLTKKSPRRRLREHQHLFTAPVFLVILAVPRLIISLLSKCMTSSRESWLFLAGYFISFIPSVLTFVLFVIPSKFYKKQFQTEIKLYRRRFDTILRFFIE